MFTTKHNFHDPLFSLDQTFFSKMLEAKRIEMQNMMINGLWFHVSLLCSAHLSPIGIFFLEETLNLIYMSHYQWWKVVVPHVT